MYIARQPIFDRNMNVYGYELLYRTNAQATTFGSSTYDSSTATVLGGLFELGLEQMVGDKKAFINFDYNFLLSDAIELIQPSTLVIEVLENIQIDDKLIERIKDLRKKGYWIALDDFEESFQDYPIAPFSDIIKYDILLTPLHEIKNEVRLAKEQKKILLAEKIETKETFLQAKEMGFHLFQGYFFSKPVIVGGLRSRKTSNVVYQRIMAELHKEDASFQKITEIIETDVNMAYRVMKVIGQKNNKKRTIKGALTRMGLIELERWISILMLQEVSRDKSIELVRLSLTRSKFGELIAMHSTLWQRRHEISLMCLFSVLDAMLDLPMEQALEGIDIDEDIKEALVYQTGRLKPIYDIIKCYETGDCLYMNKTSDDIQIDRNNLFGWYLEAIHWADTTIRKMR